MIRPTERHANNEFWVSVAGHDIDWPTLSAQPEEFARLVRGLSGLRSLEFQEFITLNYYRCVNHGNFFGRFSSKHIIG
jgi:hypothetical protein